APKPRRSLELPADAPGSRVPAVAIRLRDHRHAARAAGDGRGRAREGGRRGGARGEGAWHPERAGPRGPRSAADGRRSPPRRGRERRGSGLGRPVSVRLLLPAATAGGLRMSFPAVGQSDRKVLLALQGLVLGLPLFLGGRQPWALAAAAAVVLVLLAVTIRERRRRGAAPYPPGIAALVALVGLALATTLPLPPAVLRLIAPATARLYAEMLPGWPGSGGWTVWRPIAIDTYGVWAEISRFSIGLGAFVITVAYPWRAPAEEEDARAAVFDRLLLTLLAGGALLAG